MTVHSAADKDKANDKRVRILSAAERVFAKRGFFAARVGAPSGAEGAVEIASGSARIRVAVARQRVASVVAEPVVVRYVDWDERPQVTARVRIDRCCGEGPLIGDATVTIDGRPGLDTLDVGAHRLTLRATGTAPN